MNPSPLSAVLDAERLAALYQADLLDTPAEIAYDRITRLAARVLDVPAVAVSLVDHDRQFFKSSIGMGELLSLVKLGEMCYQTPLSHSLCQYVVGADALLRICDGTHDPFFSTHPIFAEKMMGAYLGVPLRWEDEAGKKHVFGALCALDGAPRDWSDNDAALLEEFAALVETEFRLRDAAQKSVAQVNALQAAHAARLESEARFQGLTEASPMGVFVVDATGSCVYVNPKLVQITGSSSAEELLGDALIGSLHPEDRERVARRWNEAVKKRCEFYSVHRVARPDRTGRDVWVSAKSAPLRNEPGGRDEFLGWVGTVDDISERKAAEDALAETFRFVHQITETVPLIMTVTDLHQRQNVYANHEFTSVLGYPAEDLMLSPQASPNAPNKSETGEERAFILAAMHPDDRPRYEAHLEQVLKQVAGEAPLACQYRLKHARGQWCWFRSRDTVFERDRITGAPTHLLSIAEDVTSAKNHEDRLLALTRQLQRSNSSLQEFASVASHDLQEPLRKVQAFGDRLRSRYGHILEGDGAEYLERMLAASARMQVLIDDLLRYSRVSSKAQEFRSVDLAEIARGVVGDLEARIQQTGGVVTIGPLPCIEADPMQMRQLLQNLVGNALKFHKVDCPPHVIVSAEICPIEATGAVGEENRAVCRISVQDDGIGFEGQYAERVFNVFERLHSRGHYEGTGMGLAICRKIVQRHGGTISAHSTPEQGTQFLATLPMNQPVSAPENAAIAPPSPAAAEATFLLESKGKYSV